MRNGNPEKYSIISWIIIGIGGLLAVIGAMTAQEYKVNFWLWMGAIVIVGGIVYHLVTVRCPYCGHSLAGYLPLPKVCPACHREFEE